MTETIISRPIKGVNSRQHTQYLRLNRLECEREAILRDDPDAIVTGRVRAYDRTLSQLEGELP